MDERAVRAAAARIRRESHGLYTDASGRYRLVPVAALADLAEAIAANPTPAPDPIELPAA